MEWREGMAVMTRRMEGGRGASEGEVVMSDKGVVCASRTRIVALDSGARDDG